MSLDTVNEGCTAYLTVDFKNKAGVLEKPVSATYRIDCLTNGTKIKDDTDIDPIASSVEIELTATDNALIVANNAAEKRLVTVKALYSDNDKINNEFEYFIKNLSKV